MCRFDFKEFSIRQDKTAMKVGTDGVLLGAWADIAQASTILDVGTGTGVIAIMSAQRNSFAMVDAVEINHNSFEQATENVANSKWNNRIKVHFSSIFDFHPQYFFDHIICNPPFFNNSTIAPNEGRNLARHCVNFSHEALLDYSAQYLSPSGKLSIILPKTEGERLVSVSSNYALALQRITEVFPNDRSIHPKRLLLEFMPAKDAIRIYPLREKLIIEHQHHEYTAAYKELTKDFYLNFH
ncbi:MAG: tRNA (adenine(22)-N(1))-methyltransferase TrmK [Culturomica sp.]|jgi:tRNA1Val (adenine37-N6)-methyltransferase|nr:tRNA (adenine(22)-N(1))-methyltransferase TrmK [Culturomica sp.]